MKSTPQNKISIHTFSLGDIERINTSSMPKTSLISILAPGKEDPNINFDDFEDVLHLRFHDAESDLKSNRGLTVFDQKMAKKILDFAENLRSNYLYIHCLAGQCRSCAVAFALNKILNGDDELPDEWDLYNRLVHDRIMHVHKNGVTQKTIRDSKSEKFEELFGQSG